MALKLIPLDEAARTLGITVERLNQLRERQEIYGYRDGASWKFKPQDVERLAEDLRSQTVDAPLMGDDSDELADLPFDSLDSDPLAATIETDRLQDSHEMEINLAHDTTPIPMDGLSDAESEEVILLSDRELGASEPGTSSTIIGKPGVQSPEESDIRLVAHPERGGKPGSDVKLKLDPKANESGIRLIAEPPLDVAPDAPTDLRLEDSEELSLDLLSDSSEDDLPVATAPPAKPAGKPAAGKGGGPAKKPIDDDSGDMELGAEDSEDEFAIANFGAKSSPSDSGVTLASQDLDDDDLVLSSAGGSDITLGSADSGISLASPSDSGLNLEEPLELKSMDDDSLELGGDEFAISGDGDSDSAEIAPADDDFLLTPIEDAVDADSEDSGSQVIALDSDSGFGDSGLLEAEGGMLEEDFGAVDSGSPLGAGLSSAPVMAGAGMAMPGMAPRETPYTLLNVLSLGACAMLLSLSGMMMFDLIRNMWSWDSPYGLNSWLMDTILGLFGG